MATLDTTTVFAQAKEKRAQYLLSGLIARIVAWNEVRKTRIALMALSDHELNDIGLTYADIDAVAKGAVQR